MDHTQAQVSTRALAHTNMFTKHRHGHTEIERERERPVSVMSGRMLACSASAFIHWSLFMWRSKHLSIRCWTCFLHAKSLVSINFNESMTFFFYFLWWNLILFHINRNFNIIGCPDKAKILNKNISSWTLFCATLMLCGERKKRKEIH